jgi:hypothetical protein
MELLLEHNGDSHVLFSGMRRMQGASLIRRPEAECQAGAEDSRNGIMLMFEFRLWYRIKWGIRLPTTATLKGAD